MMTMYNYHKNEDVTFNDIIDEVLMFTAARAEGKTIENHEARMFSLNEAIARYAVQDAPRAAAKFEAEGLKCFKSPMVTKNQNVREAYNAIISEVITAVMPAVSSKAYANYLAEVRQIGWGDTAVFRVKSNELFKVNEIAEGVNRGVLQPIYDNEYTVNTKTTEIATSIDWYAVAAGVFDWGDFGYRAGKSFEGYVMLKIIAAMTAATELMGPAYSAAGVDVDQWTTLVDRVSAANGGAAVYGIGTLAALNKVAPATVGYQYQIGAEMVKDGYLDRYLGQRLIPIDQVMVPGTVNTTAQLAVPTNVIFVIAADSFKPVKIVYEGNETVVEWIPEETTDKTYAIRIQTKIGVAAMVGSKFGTLTLN